MDEWMDTTCVPGAHGSEKDTGCPWKMSHLTCILGTTPGALQGTVSTLNCAEPSLQPGAEGVQDCVIIFKLLDILFTGSLSY